MVSKKIGRPKNPPKVKELLKDVLPIKDIFKEDEIKVYDSLVDIYLQDFDTEDLTSSDMDDIMSLAMNKVLELRLLKTSKDDTDKQIDISAAIEKMRKQSEKIKDNLSSRRKDRLDPNKFKGFSIVDLAYAFDNSRKFELEEKVRGLKKEQQMVQEKLNKHTGNRYDSDVNDKSNKEED